MKRKLFALCTSLCVLASVAEVAAKPRAAAAAEPARPGPDATTKPDAGAKKEASRRFEHAIKLYEDGDYSVALAEFERVYELVPDYRVLYNIGQVSIQLGHYARALLTLREYVARGGNELPADRAKAVQADMDLLAGRTASIVLEVEPEGVEVTVDGRVIGTTPLTEPVVVDVGERRVELKRTGFVSQEQTLSLAGGDRYVAQVKLLPESTADQSSRTSPPIAGLAPDALRPIPERKVKAGVWIGYGAAGALAAGAIVSGALGASSAGKLKDLRNTQGTTRDELDHAHDRAKTQLLVADVLGAAAIVTGAVTLYFHISGSGKERQHAKNDVWVGVAPNQVSLGMTPAWLQ
jgi:tetratricopeptide (TPR) repeat protein